MPGRHGIKGEKGIEKLESQTHLRKKSNKSNLTEN